MFTLFGFANESLAEEDLSDVTWIIWEGHLEKGRILVPLRAVSENIGANVKWNQQLKTVTINRGNKEITLTIGSDKAKVNGEEIAIDAPAKLEKSTTYVPLRFVSQSLGAKINWNQELIRAIITLDDKKLLVYAPEPITEQQIRAFIKKADEATDLSKYSQIRTHFNPYFTDSFINKLVRQGLARNETFPEADTDLTYYDSKRASLSNQLHFLDHTLVRSVIVIKTATGWKVDSINYYVFDHIQP